MSDESELTPSGRQLSLDDAILYDERFMDSHVGKVLLSDPIAALVELVANAWDAGATDVDITWPEVQPNTLITVLDNGTGMTDAEFQRRWRTIYYNRRLEQGDTVLFPPSAPDDMPPRSAYGRNGVGRWAAFCFDSAYTVDTRSAGLRNRYYVTRSSLSPFRIKHEVRDQAATGQGTSVSVAPNQHANLSGDSVRAELGMRFLADPGFAVRVNGIPVTFEDVRDPNITTVTVVTPAGNEVDVIVIDTQKTDRTSRQKGVAWQVLGRLVGKCSWEGPREAAIVDRRTIAARRFTFIVRADHLANAGAVRPDWSGFNEDNDVFMETADAVYNAVEHFLQSASGAGRQRTLAEAKARNARDLQAMGPLSRERWLTFVNEAQERCPRIRDDDVVNLSEIVANLEVSRSGYRLLAKLARLRPDDMDELDRILDEWTLDMAKAVLDEIATRLKVVDELQVRIRDPRTREVQDLQPLFERGLWIFGPEYESIEYTANSGMTRVIQQLFGSRGPGSLQRPDFAILPESTVGLYGCSSYDDEGSEDGVDRLVIVELKRPGIRVGGGEKEQCWRYVKELLNAGLIRDGLTKVTCFLLGSQFERHELGETQHGESVVVKPMHLEHILSRAKSRMLGLHQRVENAPFLEDHRDDIARFLEPIPDMQATFDDSQLR